MKRAECGSFFSARVEEIVSEGGDLLGYICVHGHVTGFVPRKRGCRGCGSHIEGRHATGCKKPFELVDRLLERLSEQAEAATDDEEWEAIQEQIEDELFPLGLQVTGGPL
ncbi:MAG: hypothetical protein U0787_09960 [Polyangia bacterium]